MRLSFSFKVTAAICVGLISMVGLGAFGYLSIGECYLIRQAPEPGKSGHH